MWSKEIEWNSATRRAALSGTSEFAPIEDCGLAVATVDVSAALDPMPAEGCVPDGEAQCAVTIGPDGSFLVWTKTRNGGQGEGDSAAWLDVSADGIVPETGVEYDIRFVLDYAAQAFSVSVRDGGEYRALKSADGVTAFKFALAGRSLAKVAFQGSGELASIFGSYVAIEGFAADDELVVKGAAKVILTAAQAAWLNGLGDRATVAGRAATISKKDFDDAFLLNLDITKDGFGYTFSVTSIEVGEDKVTIGVGLTREGKAGQAINGRLVFYGASAVEQFKGGSPEPMGEAWLSDDDFSEGDTATAEIPLDGGAHANFYKAAIE
jgi:hypothetical protein